MPHSRLSGPKAQNHDIRRGELADSALITLSERGYARTSLREIANNSPFSHGVVHYYFASKAELMVHCVRRYRLTQLNPYDELLVGIHDPVELMETFAGDLAWTMENDTNAHRLWFDLRNQSLFDTDLREAAIEIEEELELRLWRVVTRYFNLIGKRPPVGSATCYALVDGVFERALMQYFNATDKQAVLDEMQARIIEWFTQLAEVARVGNSYPDRYVPGESRLRRSGPAA